MKATIWRKTGSNGVSTVMLDVLFNLLMFFMILVHQKSQDLAMADGIINNQKAAMNNLNNENKGLKNENKGLRNENSGLDNENKGLKNENKGLKNENNGLKNENGGLKNTVDDLVGENEEYKSRFQSGKPLTVLFLIDTTISMEKPIQELGRGMETICEVMANRSQDFRVGIIGFRHGETSRFAITHIKPSYEDDGNSQKAVLSFIRELELVRSITEHKSVFQAGVQALAQAHSTADPDRRIILCLLGDVGPSELDEKAGYTSTEEQQAKRDIHSGLKRWVQMGNHSVMTLYAESEHTKADPAAAENKQWFQDLGSVSPGSAFYTDTTALLQAIHYAIGK